MAAKICIYRFNRTFKGSLKAEPGTRYPCGSGHAVKNTSNFAATLTLPIGPASGCDESKPHFPTGLVLRAKGTVIAREDGFAQFTSRCNLVKKEKDDKEVVYFSGTVNLVFNIGSHQALGEKCDEPRHAEGWLNVSGQTPEVRKYDLSAALVAQVETNDLKDGAGFDNTQVNRLSGVLSKRP